LLISHVDNIDEPERLSDAVLRPEPFVADGPQRSVWPVDDTTTVFFLSFVSNVEFGLSEVDSWTQFVHRFGWAGPSPQGASAVRGCFANGGRRVVVAPYVGELDEAILDLVDAQERVATIVAPDVYGRANEVDVRRAARIQIELVARAEGCRGRLVLLDAPPSYDTMQVRDWRREILEIDSWSVACYYPWIKVVDPDLGHVQSPPSGHVAGLLAYSDLRYGVQKPPANEPIRGAVAIAREPATRGESDVLNPEGINLICPVRDRGIVVWGARSMSLDPSYRSLNHCRSLHMVARLLRAGLAWVDRSDESDEALWIQLRRDLCQLLELLHAAGVLRRVVPEWSSCVRREGDRSVVVDLTLAGHSGFSRIRVGY
jgi:phage tail sheath protein FI